METDEPPGFTQGLQVETHLTSHKEDGLLFKRDRLHPSPEPTYDVRLGLRDRDKGLGPVG